MFVDYHGLSLIWSWMVDEQRDDTAEWMTLKLRILEVLDLLPIPHSTMLKDSKVLQVVQRWALAHVKNDPRQHIESYDPEVLTLLEEIISLVCHTDPLNSKHEKVSFMHIINYVIIM